MPRVIALFNLKPGVGTDEYEHWARTTDLPTVRGLASIEGFSAHRATGLLGSEGDSPYQYIEVIDILDMEEFAQDLASPTMQKVIAEFQAFAADPCFILTEAI